MNNREIALLGRRRFRALSAVLGAVVVLAPMQAPAQSSAPSPASLVEQAREHFTRGVSLYERQDYRASLSEFIRAYELAPNLAVLYNVGRTYYRLRDYPNALRTLERYVAEGEQQIPPQRRARIDEELAEVRKHIAHVTIDVNTPGAEVFIDDVVVGKAPLAGSLMVGEGRRTIAARKPGFVAASKVFDLAGGDRLSIRLTLPKEPSAPAPVIATIPVTRPPHGALRNLTPAYVSLAVGGAGVVAGSVFGIMALSNKSHLDSTCSGKACPEQSRDDLDALSRNTTFSTIGYGIGWVGAAVGLYLWVTATPSEERRESPRRVSARPWVEPGALGFSGTF